MNKHNEHHLFTEGDIKVITAALLVFSYEIEEKVKNAYLNSEKVNLPFSLEDITCVRNWFLDLYRRRESTEKTKVFLCSNTYRRAIVYVALSDCNKNFERYKTSNLGIISQEDFHSVFKSFKEFFPELES